MAAGKILLTYASKYGATETYARWIGDALEIEPIPYKKVSADDLASCSTLIHGGGLYGGGIAGSKLITKNSGILLEKHLVVFTVGISSAGNSETFNPVIEQNFQPELRERITFFHLRGGMDYKKLSFLHKTMMGAMRKALQNKKPEELSADDTDLLEAYDKKADFTDRDSLSPLLEYVRNL